MANFGILAKIGVDASQMTAGLDKAGKDVDSFGDRLGSAIKAGAAVAAAAIAGMTIKGVADFMSFEKKMAEVFTLLPHLTAEAEEKMTADMRNLAKTMGIDLIDATNALYQAISAGIPEENVMTFLETAAKASIAGVSDLETSVNALTTIMDGYGMSATEAERVSDVLFSTLTIGKTNFTELGDNIGKVTPLAAQLGITIEEVGAMFATLTKNLGAGKTAEAGTQIRSMLAELSKEGMKAFENFVEASGKTFPDFIKAGGSVAEALQLLTDHAKKTDKGLLDMFRGVEAGMAALILAADESKNLATAFEFVTKGAGSMGVAFERMEKTASRQWDKMKGGWNDLLITMGAAVLPMLNAVLPGLRAAFELVAGAVITVADAFEDYPRLLTAVKSLFKGLVATVTVYLAIATALALKSAAVAVAMRVAAAATLLFGSAVKTANMRMKSSAIGVLLALLVGLGVAMYEWITASDDAEEANEAHFQKERKRLRELEDSADKTIAGIKKEREERKKSEELRRKEKDLRTKGMRSELEILKELATFAKEESAKEIKRIEINLAAKRKEHKERKAQNEEADQTATDRWMMEEAATVEHNKAIAQEKQLKADVFVLEEALTKEIKNQADAVQAVLDLEIKTREEAEGRVKSVKEAKAIFADTLRLHKLSKTEVGKALILTEDIMALERERVDLLAKIEEQGRLDVGSKEKLKTLTQDILKKEQALADLIKTETNKARQEEIDVIQDAVDLLDKKLKIQEQIAQKAKEAADAAEKELLAQRKKFDEAAKDLRDLGKKFGGEKFDVKGERIGLGAMKLSSAKLRREFRDLQAQGQLPEGVKTLRDFRKHVEDQIRAAQQKAAIEKNKGMALVAEAKKQRQLEEDAANKIKDIKKEIGKEERAIIALQEKLLEKEKKSREEINAARLKWEALLALVAKPKGPDNLLEDIGVIMAKLGNRAEAATKALGDLSRVLPPTTGPGQETYTTQAGEIYDAFSGEFLGMDEEMKKSNKELKLQTESLADIRQSTAFLRGFFVNQ